MRDGVAELHLAVDQRLHGPERERRVVGKALDDGGGGLFQVGRLCQMRDEAELVHAGCRQGVAEQQDFPRRRGAGDLQQLFRQEPAWREAHLRQRHAEAGICAGHHQIAMQRQFVAAGDSVAVHDADDGQRENFDQVQHLLDAGFALRMFRPPFQVEAGAEHRAGGANDHQPLVRLRRDSKDGLQFLHHVAVEGVALLGPVEDDGADGAFNFPVDLGHVFLRDIFCVGCRSGQVCTSRPDNFGRALQSRVLALRNGLLADLQVTPPHFVFAAAEPPSPGSVSRIVQSFASLVSTSKKPVRL